MATYTDKQLHELARKRVDFRRHLIVYCIVNGMLWLIWYLIGQKYPWPLWPMGGWAIGLIFHYIFEYRNPKILSEEEEYNKLKSKGTQP